MPKFDEGSIGGELEYKFTKWLDESYKDRVGVVPEPSRPAVNSLMKRIQNDFKEMGIVDNEDGGSTTPGEIADRMNKIDDDALFETLAIKITEAVADVCNGTPSLKTLMALPYRPFMGFFGFLVGNLMNPEASKPDSNNSPRRLTSV
jgi:hypothetical protein